MRVLQAPYPMGSLIDGLASLLDPTGFVPRATCGQWTRWEILLNNISDLLVALAYVSIPIMLMIFFSRRQRDFPFSWLSAVFAAFILTCGATHVMEIILFYHPIYHLAGWVKAVTAVASWIAVFSLYKILPHALALHSPSQLQAAKDEITASHKKLQEKLLLQNQKLAETNDQLQETLKQLEFANESKSRFLANLSHELRTPMVGIIGMSELALEDESWNMRESLAKIGKSARSLDVLLSDLLEFSKLEAGKLELRPRPFQVGALADDVTSTLKWFATSRKLEIKEDISPELLPFHFQSDASRLKHVLVNLLQNALKFTDHGHVTLSITLQSRSSDQAVLRFGVKDTGVGIASDRLASIFEPFVQVDDSLTKRQSGSGLGLAICREILLLLGSRLHVESKLEQGSRFWFDLDLPIVELPPALPADDVLAFRPARILLIEDNPINRTILEKILVNAGHSVLTAANGSEALEILDTESFEIALVDLQLPDIDGITIARRVRERGFNVPLLALTAHGEESYRTRALAAGMNGFLIKPIPSHELLQAIQAELSKQTGA